MIKKFLKRLFKQQFISKVSNIKDCLLNQYTRKSYSQCGEDIILNNFLNNIKKGFYIDIGAHHPKRISNTYLFYKKGRNGINIDCMPGSMKLFNIFRKRDINLEIGIGKKESEMIYYNFKDYGFNGFNKELSEERIKKGIKLNNKQKIKVFPLSKILEKYEQIFQNIDFMSIDVEGMDIDILKSNNRNKFKPTFIVIEIYGDNIHDILQNDIAIYLKNIGYKLTDRVKLSCIFKKGDSL